MDEEMRAAIQKASDEIQAIVAERDKYKRALVEIVQFWDKAKDKNHPGYATHMQNIASRALFDL